MRKHVAIASKVFYGRVMDSFLFQKLGLSGLHCPHTKEDIPEIMLRQYTVSIGTGYRYPPYVLARKRIGIFGKALHKTEKAKNLSALTVLANQELFSFGLCCITFQQKNTRRDQLLYRSRRDTESISQ